MLTSIIHNYACKTVWREVLPTFPQQFLDILAYSIDCKAYMGILHRSNKTLYVNFFNTFKLKMATNFAVSIVYSSCHKNILCFCSRTAHDRYLHVMKRNIISL